MLLGSVGTPSAECLCSKFFWGRGVDLLGVALGRSSNLELASREAGLLAAQEIKIDFA